MTDCEVSLETRPRRERGELPSAKYIVFCHEIHQFFTENYAR